MKVIAIGDIHGRDNWKNISVEDFDKIIFLGDYCDSFYFPDAAILNNLKEIIELKKKFPEKVVLIFGNHDVHYIFYPQYRATGFRESMRFVLHDLFEENYSLFQIAFQINNYLFTHAGVSNAWFAKHEQILLRYGYQKENISLAETLNRILNSSSRDILMEVGSIRGGYSWNTGGIVWADRSETKNDFLNGFHQIVGHSPVPDILKTGNENESITYIDCLETMEKFWELTLV